MNSAKRPGSPAFMEDSSPCNQPETGSGAAEEEQGGLSAEPGGQARCPADELRSLFAVMAEAAVILDSSGAVLEANQAALASLGFDPTGRPWEAVAGQVNFRHPDGSPIPAGDLPHRQALRGERVNRQRLAMTGATGEERVVSCSAVPLPPAGETVGGFGCVLTWQDFTEGELLAAENRRRHDILERLVREAPEAIAFLQAPDYRHTLVNPAYKEFARGKGEVLGRTATEVWPELTARIQPALRYVITTGKPLRGIDQALQVEREAGPETIAFTFSLTPVPDGHGQIEGVIFQAIETTGEQRALEELQAAHLRLRRFVDANIVGIIMGDSDGNIRDANDYYLNLIGCTRQELEAGGIRWEQLTPPQYLPDNTLALEAARGGGNCAPYEKEYIRKDGSRVWVLIGFASVDDGQTVGFVLDITTRKSIERALQESEEQFRYLADAMPHLVWTAQPDGSVDYYNRRYLEILGVEPGESWNWVSVLHPEDREKTVAAWNRAVERGEVYQVEHRVKLKDGEYQWFLSRSEPVRDKGGKIIQWYGTAINIHEQKEIEAALIENRRYLMAVLENLPIGVWLADAEGHIYYTNQASQKIWGYNGQATPDDYARIQSWLAGPEDAVRPAEWALTRAIQKGETSLGEVIEIQTFGQQRKVIRNSAVPILDEAGHVQGAVILVEDITAQQNAEQALKKTQLALERYARNLERSNRELEQFAFVASHDLQEPLRKVDAFGQRLAQNLAGKLEPTEKDFLDRMIHASRRMQEMIAGLLAYSRVSTTVQPFERMDLNEVVQEALSDLELRVERSGARIQVETLPAIIGDRLQIRQLVQNLVANALKFHRPDLPPEIHISTMPGFFGKKQSPDADLETEWVTLVIQDNGIGFNLRHLERIFKPFERLHGRSEYEGTGMGLAICKKIVERHQGNITAQSVEGEGTSFYVSLPLQQSALD